MIDKFGENSFYPTLEQPLEFEGTEFHHKVDQEIYRLNRTNEIIKDLKKEKKHYESVYKKYKKLHKSLLGIQMFFNTSSILTTTCAAVMVGTGIGVVAAAPLGIFATTCAVFGIISGIFDQKALKKIKKHSKIVLLIDSVDSNIIRKYLSDQKINKDEFNEILKIIEKYYSAKEEIRSKSRLIGNI